MSSTKRKAPPLNGDGSSVKKKKHENGGAAPSTLNTTTDKTARPVVRDLYEGVLTYYGRKYDS